MKTRSTLALLLPLAAAAPSAPASIVSATGQFFHIGPPPSLVSGAMFSNTAAQAIDERQNVLFTGTVDILGPTAGPPYTIQNAAPAFLGTWVSSHIMHADSNGPDITGIITFADPIVALIYENTRLDMSDGSLGNAATVYPTGQLNRGFGVTNTGLDSVRVLNAYTLQVTLGAGMDELRVLTIGVPAPGGAAALALGGVLASGRRRRAGR